MIKWYAVVFISTVHLLIGVFGKAHRIMRQESKKVPLTLITVLGILIFFAGAVLNDLIGNIIQRYFYWSVHNTVTAFVIILLTIFIGIITSWRLIQHRIPNTKELSWDIISDTQVLSINKELAQILLDKHPLSDAHLLVLKISNTGNIPILREDYEDAIQFNFGKEIKILSAEIVNTEPSGLKDRVPFKVDAENAFLGPLLLNSKDAITFKVLLIGRNFKIIPLARIKGLSQILSKKGKFLSLAL